MNASHYLKSLGLGLPKFERKSEPKNDQDIEDWINVQLSNNRKLLQMKDYNRDHLPGYICNHD